ncbi:MAG TPA: M48 family metalloprotease [Pyrinomonadaceae bacterium]|jgi:Peptidase family M48|nr:M48 family metalloprotease [Pyrinomonadaceae bacterium]
MQTVQTRYSDPKTRVAQERGDHAGLGLIASCLIAAFLALVAFYCSLIASSAPVRPEDRAAVNRAIKILEDKGFDREVFLLRHTAAFRGSDNWLNNLTKQDNAYAATNFPFQIVTLYTDFYQKAKDDTERAMVLLHEAQHLKGKDEHDAYAYVWQNRARLGWTQISYGTTPSYITIEEQTRENAPELFTCQQKLWNDCTETLRARK